MRVLTVSRLSYDAEFPRFVPYIRLRGKWLEKLGWQIGEKIEVSATEKEILIRKGGNNHELDKEERV